VPELPEVEVTRRSLGPLLVDRTIAEVRTTRPSYFFLTAPATLRRRLSGRRVVALERHGKYLLLDLDDGSRLLLHLGMTGQLFSSKAASPRLLSAERRSSLDAEGQRAFTPDEHTHLVLRFSDRGPDVFFRDVRKFGKVRHLPRGRSDPRLDRLGPDALSVTPALLEAAARRRSAPIKSLLLDQSVLAGVGNIYADEALFLAGVRPTRSARRLTRVELEALARALRDVLMKGIASGGSSIDDFVRPDGSDGSFQDEHFVYGRDGAACRRCGTPISRRVIAQRSSHYCRRCQR